MQARPRNGVVATEQNCAVTDVRAAHHFHATEEISFRGIPHQRDVAEVAHIEPAHIGSDLAIVQTIMGKRLTNRGRREIAVASVPGAIHRHAENRQRRTIAAFFRPTGEPLRGARPVWIFADQRPLAFTSQLAFDQPLDFLEFRI